MTTANPMRTDGFEFVEYAAPDPELLRRCSRAWACPRWRAIARRMSPCTAGRHQFHHQCRARQLRARFARAHGPCACAMAFRVADAALAYARALELGAKPGSRSPPGPWNSTFPSIEGIGGSLIYLVDRYGERTIYDVDFVPVAADAAPTATSDSRAHRSSDPQREARQHERVGRLLREAVQLPRNPLLQHRGQGDRTCFRAR
jgi:4-hydroxyphenylpyruvate dioxygenase